MSAHVGYVHVYVWTSVCVCVNWLVCTHVKCCLAKSARVRLTGIEWDVSAESGQNVLGYTQVPKSE